MTFSILILGVLIILVSFNVGESVYKKLKISKKHLLIILISSLVLYFIPSPEINGITFTWTGFFMPLLLSVFVLLKIKKAKVFFKLFVATLITFSLGIIYNLITFDVYESAIFQPYLILGIILGSVLLLIVNNPIWLFSSNFLGLIFAEIVFYLSRYSIYGEYYLNVGSRKVFEILITAFITSTLVYFFARKVKLIIVKRKLSKGNYAKI